jgi:hypothetical protein
VERINQFILERGQNGEKDHSPSLTLTLAEMELLEQTKAVVLVLVHLKRLDIGSVDGTKVYIVRKS